MFLSVCYFLFLLFFTCKPITESEHKRFDVWGKVIQQNGNIFLYLFSIINTRIIQHIRSAKYNTVWLCYFGGCFEHKKVKKAHWLYKKQRMLYERNVRTHSVKRIHILLWTSGCGYNRWGSFLFFWSVYLYCFGFIFVIYSLQRNIIIIGECDL